MSSTLSGRSGANVSWIIANAVKKNNNNSVGLVPAEGLGDMDRHSAHDNLNK